MPLGLNDRVERVAVKIRELRTGVGMTQADLLRAAGPLESLSRLDNLEHPASHRAIARIARTLGVDVGEIDPGSA